MGLKSIITAGAVISLTNITFAMADIKVVTSIKPVHSLVSGVMLGVGNPSLIIEGAGSPHTYSLKPSQAKQLQDAKLVFWMGDELETFLEGPIENIAQKATAIKLIDAHGLKKIRFRDGGMFDDHGHDDHDDHEHDDHDHEKHAKKEHDDHSDHDGHDDHDHEKHAKKEHDDHSDHDGHDDHDHEKHAKKEHDDHSDHDGHDDHDHEKHAKKEHDDHSDHDGHDDHGHGEFDPHVWLDPVNAKAIVHEIEEALVKADPKHASTYEANAHKMMEKLDSLVVELSDELEPVHEKGFIVFHDAYQYFEQRFDVAAIGSITVSPEVMPGAERVSELREKILELNATCVFSEPQFEPKLVATLVEDTGARTGVLDPLGATLNKGPDLYFQLLRNMASSLKKCLSGGI
jgi:zinc transport system substrate-binding protein